MDLNSVFMLSVLGVLILGGGLYFVILYNALVASRNQCERAWTNIDVPLKQRFDEVPSLVAVCKAYMRHEEETLRVVTQARTDWSEARNLQQRVGAGLQAGDGFRKLFTVAEQYPELNTDRSFLLLQQRITDLECQIADRREFYNECVNNYNSRIAQFPDIWVSQLFAFSAVPLFEAPGERSGATVV